MRLLHVRLLSPRAVDGNVSFTRLVDFRYVQLHVNKHQKLTKSPLIVSSIPTAVAVLVGLPVMAFASREFENSLNEHPFSALLGQVQNRLRLNWLGERAHPGDQSPFKILLGITIAIMVWSTICSSLLSSYIDPSTGLPIVGSPYWAINGVNQAFSLAVGVFSIYIVLKTRQYIRQRSGIPETSCQGCEDCCCATFCQCCAVMQMARHTAEYETYAGQCCSETGLPVNAPQLQFGGAEIV